MPLGTSVTVAAPGTPEGIYCDGANLYRFPFWPLDDTRYCARSDESEKAPGRYCFNIRSIVSACALWPAPLSPNDPDPARLNLILGIISQSPANSSETDLSTVMMSPGSCAISALPPASTAFMEACTSAVNGA